MANENKKELPIWKRIKQGDKLPCQSFLRKYDGEILRLTTTGGVTVGQDCFYLPVENVIEEIRKYPIEESKDEKMIQYFKDLAPFDKAEELYEKYGFSHKDAIAWLEKQGKQNRYTPVFTFDDVLALQCAMANAKDSDEKLYHALQSLHDRVHDAYSNEKQDEQKIQPKFEVGDVMRTLEEANSGITDGMPVVVSIDDKYYRCNNELIAIKDQDDYEYPPMNRKQESSDWSEEDEQYLLICKNALAKYQVSDKWDAIIISRWLEDKLKSLRPQSQWKPSDEHLDALNNMRFAVEHFGPSASLAALDDLYNQLKRLTE